MTKANYHDEQKAIVKPATSAPTFCRLIPKIDDVNP